MAGNEFFTLIIRVRFPVRTPQFVSSSARILPCQGREAGSIPVRTATESWQSERLHEVANFEGESPTGLNPVLSANGGNSLTVECLVVTQKAMVQPHLLTPIKIVGL